MKLIIAENVYMVTRQQLDGILKIAKKQINSGVYAVEKDDVCELRRDPIEEASEYEKKGFIVYKCL